MKMWKKVVAATLCLMMVLSLAACGGKKKEVLTVGVSPDYPPYEYYDANGKMAGSDIELAKYIAEKLGMELELVAMGFDGLLGSLESGDLDLVISGMSIRPDRHCLFSDPYLFAEQALLVPAGMADAYASLDELMGKKIGGQTGALQADLAKQYAGDGAQIVGNVQDMIMMVGEGKLDGMFCEKAVADSAAAKSDKVVVASVAVPTEENLLAVCMKSGDTAMAEKINPIIKDVMDKNLYGEWLLAALDAQ